jgi:VanZ family protein
MWILFNKIANIKFLILWSILIVFLCLLPIPEKTSSDFLDFKHKDKLAHFVFYFVASLIYFLEKNNRLKIFPVLSYAILLGGTIELIQYYFIETRNGDIWDMLANISGALSFIVFLKLFGRFFISRLQT